MTTRRPPRLPSTAKIEPEVAASIRSAAGGDAYAGARRLALKYARAMDDAAELARAADAIEIDPDDDAAAYRELDRLRARVRELTVLQDLGPKLLAALVELRATPRSRTALMTTPAPPSAPAPPEGGASERASRLASLRDRAGQRIGRIDRAPAVDPPAP